MEYVASYGIKYLFLVVVLSLGVSFSFAKDNKVLDTSRIDKLILAKDPKKTQTINGILININNCYSGTFTLSARLNHKRVTSKFKVTKLIKDYKKSVKFFKHSCKKEEYEITLSKNLGFGKIVPFRVYSCLSKVDSIKAYVRKYNMEGSCHDFKDLDNCIKLTTIKRKQRVPGEEFNKDSIIPYLDLDLFLKHPDADAYNYNNIKTVKEIDC